MRLRIVTVWQGKYRVIILQGGWNGTDTIELSSSLRAGVGRRSAIRKLQRVIRLLEQGKD